VNHEQLPEKPTSGPKPENSKTSEVIATTSEAEPSTIVPPEVEERGNAAQIRELIAAVPAIQPNTIDNPDIPQHSPSIGVQATTGPISPPFETAINETAPFFPSNTPTPRTQTPIPPPSNPAQQTSDTTQPLPPPRLNDIQQPTPTTRSLTVLQSRQPSQSRRTVPIWLDGALFSCIAILLALIARRLA